MKKVLVIGAGFLQDFIIRRAVSLGYETVTVDADPHAPGFAHAARHALISIVDQQACLDYARQEHIDGVLTAATDYGVLSASYVARELGLPGLDYETAQLIKNKYRVRRCLYENRVDDTEQAYEVDADTDLEALARKVKYPVMVKPCDGSGSRGTCRVDRPEDLAAACAAAMNDSMTRRTEIESFISGQEYGAESFVLDGNVHVLAVMKKKMTAPPYYAELGHAIPCGLSPAMEQKVKDCAERAIKALGINFGAVNMDMLITPDGRVSIVDVGARMGGNLIASCIVPYGTGIDYPAAMIRAAVGDPADLTPGPHSAVATRLLAFPGKRVLHLPEMKAIERDMGVEIYHHMKNGMKVHEYHTNLDGCGYIVAKGHTAEEAESKAQRALDMILAETFGEDGTDPAGHG